MEPNSLRRRIIEKRKLIPEKERSEIFLKILHFLHNLSEYNTTKSIIAYYGKVSSGEFDTLPLLNQIINRPTKLFLPRCRENKLGLDIYEIQNVSYDTELGSYGIAEPKKNPQRFKPFNELDEPLIIVPGSVFDRNGNRYGYGAGYYDRFLKELNEILGLKPKTVALSYSFAVLDSPLKTKPTDIPIDIIITEKEVIYANKKKLGN